MPIAKEYDKAQKEKDPKKLKLPEIETVEYLYKGEDIFVEYKFPELTALCPKTGLPDFYELKVLMIPDKYLPELKSLKLYLVAFRKVGIFHEHLAVRIFNDFVKAVKPKFLSLELKANVRGGIYTTVRKIYKEVSKKAHTLQY